MQTRGRVNIISFSLRHQKPIADFMIDVSFLRNPARQNKWSLFTEVNDEMKVWMKEQAGFGIVVNSIARLIVEMIEYDNVICAVGCNGGRHRSPIVAEAVGDALNGLGIEVEVQHLCK